MAAAKGRISVSASCTGIFLTRVWFLRPKIQYPPICSASWIRAAHFSLKIKLLNRFWSAKFYHFRKEKLHQSAMIKIITNLALGRESVSHSLARRFSFLGSSSSHAHTFGDYKQTVKPRKRVNHLAVQGEPVCEGKKTIKVHRIGWPHRPNVGSRLNIARRCSIFKFGF